MGSTWAGRLLTVRIDAELFHVYCDGVLLKTVLRHHPQRCRSLRPQAPTGSEPGASRANRSRLPSISRIFTAADERAARNREDVVRHSGGSAGVSERQGARHSGASQPSMT
jgi:hypothetical protein